MAEDRRRDTPPTIKQWRLFRGFKTQDKLVDRVIELFPNEAFTVASLSRLETGAQGITRGTLDRLAAALQCRAGDLIDVDPYAPGPSVTNEVVSDLRLQISVALTKLATDQRPIHEWPESLLGAVLTVLQPSEIDPTKVDSAAPKARAESRAATPPPVPLPSGSSPSPSSPHGKERRRARTSGAT